jgi:alanine racemase
MLYGLYPAPAQRALADLRPAMTLDAAVVRVAEVGPGEGIGYGHSYRTRVRARIATVRIGYADGYPRALSNRGHVLIHGRSAPVIGRVCMDHVMVDASGIAEVRLGDRAVLWGTGLPAEEVAALADTIAYELVSRVGTRVARVYEEAEEEDS